MQPFRFRDDFDEYRARAHSGGYIFGLIRRGGQYQQLTELDMTTTTNTTNTTTTTPTTTSSCTGGGGSSPRHSGGGGGCRFRSKSMAPRSQPHRRSLMKQKSNSCETLLDLISPSSGSENGYSLPILTTHPCNNDNNTETVSDNRCNDVSPLIVGDQSICDIGDDMDSMFLQPPPLQRQRAQSAPNTNIMLVAAAAAGGGGDSYRRRSFCITNKGIVHEGDFLVQRPPSNSALPLVSIDAYQQGAGMVESASRASSLNSSDGLLSPFSGCSSEGPSVCRILVLGSGGVGKTSLTRQFLTCEHLGAQNVSFGKYPIICELYGPCTVFALFLALYVHYPCNIRVLCLYCQHYPYNY
jgi:hypothetical protein